MTLRQHMKKNVSLATPVVIGQLGHIMVSVADTAMVGQVGVVPLAASTFAGTFIAILMLFGIGVSYALTPLVAAEENDGPKILEYVQNSLLVNTLLGFLIVFIIFLISPFLDSFGQEESVAEAARSYLLIAGSSLLPLMIFQTFRQFSEGKSNTLNPMIVSISANLLNVGLNYIFIFGKLGLPEMGLDGAGWATFISRLLMAIMMILIIRKELAGFVMEFQAALVMKLVRIGVPSGLQYIFEVSAFAIAAIMVGWLGAEALAAHQIALNMAAITYMAATGIASAAQIRVANQMGLRDKTTLREAGFTCFILVTAFMTFCGAVFIVFRDYLPALYIDNPEVQSLASSLLIIAAAFQISDGLQAVGLGVLRGLTDVKVPTLVTFTAFAVVAIPLGYVFGFEMELGVKGVWYALSIGLTIAAILHMTRFRSLTKKLKFSS